MRQLLSDISGVPLHLDDQARNICVAFMYSEYAEARDRRKMQRNASFRDKDVWTWGNPSKHPLFPAYGHPWLGSLPRICIESLTDD